jgi:NADH dehydrogenase FAD-containing subunit
MRESTMQSLVDSSRVFLVTSMIFCLYWIFCALELWIWLPSRLMQILLEAMPWEEGTGSGHRRPTVVIVGGNFSGLAALEKLCEKANLFKIVLIDQRDYFEYTPGILRLFCQPDHFTEIAKKLSPGDDSKHKFIQGRVVSIFGEPESSTTADCDEAEKPSQKSVTYRPIVTNTNGVTMASASTQTLNYDYLILATGATYPAPIWPTANEWTLNERGRGWRKVHKELLEAQRVVVLGAGAVGVELAAEIVDYYGRSKEITLVDAARCIVPLFPKSSGKYAYKWLQRRGVKFQLGRKLSSWTGTSCTFPNGTVIEADIVYNCLGSRPNTEILDAGSLAGRAPIKQFVFTRNRNIVVERTLQVRGGPIRDGSIFACGDVASPPSGSEKQAFQAETQGKIAAENVMLLSSPASSAAPKLKLYPQDLMMDGSDHMPLVVDLSLGRYDGIISFNGLCVPGPFAAVIKWILEYTKVLQMQGRPLGKLIWKIGDQIVLFLSSTVLKSKSLASKKV